MSTAEREAADRAKALVELESSIEKALKAITAVAAAQDVSVVYDGGHLLTVAEWARKLEEIINLSGFSEFYTNPIIKRRLLQRFVNQSVLKQITEYLHVNPKLKDLYKDGKCNADDFIKCLTIVQFRENERTVVELAYKIDHLPQVRELSEIVPILEDFSKDFEAYCKAFNPGKFCLEVLRGRLLTDRLRTQFDDFVRINYKDKERDLTTIADWVHRAQRERVELALIRDNREPVASSPKPAQGGHASSTSSPPRSPTKTKSSSSTMPTASSASSPTKSPSPPSPGPAGRTRASWKVGDPYTGGTCYSCLWAVSKGKSMWQEGKHPSGPHCPNYQDFNKLSREDRQAFIDTTKARPGSTSMLATAAGIYLAATIHLDDGTVMQPVYVDTGSHENLIAQSMVDEHHIPTRSASAKTLAGIGGTTVVLRVVDLPITFLKQGRTLNCYVVPTLPAGIKLVLGLSYMHKNAFDIIHSQNKVICGGEGSVPFVYPITGEDPIEQLTASLIAMEVSSPENLYLPPEERTLFEGKGYSAPELLRALEKKTTLHPSAAPAAVLPTPALVSASGTPTTALVQPQLDFSRVSVDKDLSESDRAKIIEAVSSRPDAWFDPDAPDTLGKAKGVVFTIPMNPDTERRPPVLPRGYRVSPQDWAIISAWLRESLRIGRVEQADYALFLNRLVVVRTRDEQGNLKIRICLDLRQVNSHTLKLPYPQRHPYELLAELEGYNFLGSIDLRASFEQVPLQESDRPKVCFFFNGQLYRWKVMTFGAINAPFVMQRVIDMALQPVRDLARALIDDIIITTKGGIDTYCTALVRVLDALIDYNLKGALSKAKLGYTTLDSLGHVVSGLGVGIPSHRVKAILDMAPPVNAADAVSKLAGFGYFRRFIPGYSELVAPIQELSLGKAPYVWTDAHHKAWAELKSYFAKAPILRHPRPDLPYFIRTDASGYAIAAVILQEHEGFLHPVFYYSRKLNKHERGRSTTDLEMLAMDEGLHVSRLLTLGAPARTLETDHIAAEGVLKAEDFANDRQKRTVLRIQEFYPLRIVHRKGKSPQMRLPDAMSRDAQYLLSAPSHLFDQAVALLAPIGLPSSISEAQMADVITASIIEALLSNHVALNPEAEVIRLQFAKELHVRNGILYHVANRRGRYLTRVYVPTSLRKPIIDARHAEAHLRGDAIYSVILDQFFWPDAVKEIDYVIHNCVVCAQVNATHQRLTGYMEARPVGFPGQQLWFDYIDLPMSPDGYDTALTAVDPFDLYCYAVPMKGKGLPATVDAIMDIVLDNDPPAEWGADNAPQFLSEAMQDAARLLGVQPRYISTYLPRANPDERLNREIKQLLTKLSVEEPLRWPFYLKFVLRGLRTAPKLALNHLSPYQMRRGRRPATVLDRQLGLSPELMRNVDYATHIGSEIAKGVTFAIETREKTREDVNRALQTAQVVAVFNIGDSVMVERKDKKSLEPRYAGPYRVRQILDQSNFLLDMPGGEKPIHMSLLKKFPGTVLPNASHSDLELLRGDPADWVETSTSDRSAATATSIIGSRIRVYWPKLREWLDGIVTRRNGKQHEVYYWDLEDKSYLERLIGYKTGTRWKLLRPRTSASEGGSAEGDPSSTPSLTLASTTSTTSSDPILNKDD